MTQVEVSSIMILWYNLDYENPHSKRGFSWLRSSLLRSLRNHWPLNLQTHVFGCRDQCSSFGNLELVQICVEHINSAWTEVTRRVGRKLPFFQGKLVPREPRKSETRLGNTFGRNCKIAIHGNGSSTSTNKLNHSRSCWPAVLPLWSNIVGKPTMKAAWKFIHFLLEILLVKTKRKTQFLFHQSVSNVPRWLAPTYWIAGLFSRGVCYMVG